MKINNRTASEEKVLKVNDNGDELRLVLKVMHSKERKSFMVYISRPVCEKAEGTDNIFFYSYRLMEDSKFLSQIPVARYSEKKLIEVFNENMNVLEDERVIEWASSNTEFNE